MFISRTRISRTIVITSATAALFAAGCGDDDSGSTPSTDHAASSSATTSTGQAGARSDFNDADVTFLQGMHPHHAQAVEMAQLVPSRTQNEQLRALAADIEKAQAPEMEQISSLLRSFGRQLSTTTGGHGGHGDNPGMMTPGQMSALQAASSADFDRRWLHMMIDHHIGAVTMSNAQLAGGLNADTKALAQTIVTAQQAEITTMRAMLGER